MPPVPPPIQAAAEDDPFRAAATGADIRRDPSGLRGGAAADERPRTRAAADRAPRRRRRNATLVDAEQEQPPQGELVGALLVLESDGSARAIALREGRLRIGREPHNDLTIDDPRVSADHAILRVDAERAWLLDTSTNGTIVGGERLIADRADLADGTIIEVGSTLLVVQLLASDTLAMLRGAGP